MFQHMQLGRNKAPHDGKKRVRLALADYIDKAKLPERKPTLPIPDGALFGMFENDRLGDCVVAAYANRAILEAARDRVCLGFLDADVERTYLALTGGLDFGLVPYDAYEALLAQGFPLGGWYRAVARASIALDLESLKLACDLFGGVLLGAEMPLTAQQGGGVWTASAGANGAPGSWGGHALTLGSYQADGEPLGLITWGAVQLADESWIERYVDDAEVILSAYHLGMPGVAGQDLLADLRTLSTD